MKALPPSHLGTSHSAYPSANYSCSEPSSPSASRESSHCADRASDSMSTGPRRTSMFGISSDIRSASWRTFSHWTGRTRRRSGRTEATRVRTDTRRESANPGRDRVHAGTLRLRPSARVAGDRDPALSRERDGRHVGCTEVRLDLDHLRAHAPDRLALRARLDSPPRDGAHRLDTWPAGVAGIRTVRPGRATAGVPGHRRAEAGLGDEDRGAGVVVATVSLVPAYLAPHPNRVPRNHERLSRNLPKQQRHAAPRSGIRGQLRRCAPW